MLLFWLHNNIKLFTLISRHIWYRRDLEIRRSNFTQVKSSVQKKT